AGSAEPASARALYRKRLFLEARAARGATLFQARQQGLPRNRRDDGVDRQARTHRSTTLCRSITALPSLLQRACDETAARDASRTYRDLFRSAALLVHAV